MSLRIEFEFPVSSGQARANNIPKTHAQLLIGPSEDPSGDALMGRAFEEILPPSADVVVVVFGQFEDIKTNQANDFILLGSILGANAYATRTNRLWSNVSEIRAEWLAVIDHSPGDFASLVARLEPSKSGLFRFSATTELGRLTSQPDLIDPLLVYYPLNKTLEVLGTSREVLKRLDAIRDFAFG